MPILQQGPVEQPRRGFRDEQQGGRRRRRHGRLQNHPDQSGRQQGNLRPLDPHEGGGRGEDRSAGHRDTPPGKQA